MSLGFNQKSAHRIIDLQECPVLLPQIFALLEPLRLVLKQCLNPGVSADILTTATDTGVEIVIRAHDRLKGGHKKPLPLLSHDARESLLQFATSQSLCRLIWHSAGHRPETLYNGQKPNRLSRWNCRTFSNRRIFTGNPIRRRTNRSSGHGGASSRAAASTIARSICWQWHPDPAPGDGGLQSSCGGGGSHGNRCPDRNHCRESSAKGMAESNPVETSLNSPFWQQNLLTMMR